MKIAMRWSAALVLILAACGMAQAATYYVDFEGGNDSKSGTSPEAAFQHSPGDPQAGGAAKAVQLAPGDTVILKGGVTYRGTIAIKSSGTPDKPITIEGNSAGAFGQGRAIVDGSTLLSGWKRSASADEAKGNPRSKDIFYVDIPKPADWRTLNLCDAEKPLPVSQDPKPSDTFFQEEVSEYYQVDGNKIGNTFPGKIRFEPGTTGNAITPLTGILGGQPAVVQPITGGAFTIELDNPVTVTAVGIKRQPNYAAVKEVAFYGDGNELLKATLAKDAKDIQKFDLPAPATFRRLTVKLLSAYEGEKGNWTKIARVAAYTADGKNVLDQEMLTTIQDEKALTKTEAHYYDGMWVGVHGGNNFVFFQQVRRFDPAAHRLFIDNFTESLYKTTRYCLYNSVRLIDRPGEFSVEPTADAKTWRIYLLPEKLDLDQPVGIVYSTRGEGVSLTGASNVVVRGLLVRRQGHTRPSGISAHGGGNITIADCEVTLIGGGAGIDVVDVDHPVVENCYVHHCPGLTRGIVLRNCKNVSTRRCRIVKNTSTALDYYNCQGGDCRDNVVTDHRGMHANGLTFYLGCKDLVIERNEVHTSNVSLTIQEAENIVIRNNVFDAGNRTLCVGIWPGTPLRNVQFLNNVLVRSKSDDDWSAAVFSNNRSPEGLVFRNNVIDGLSGSLPGTFEHNLYTRWGPGQKDQKLGKGEIYEADLKKLFVDPDHGDFHPRAGSPAIDAGMDVGLKEDMVGTKSPQGKAPDIGAYEFKP